MVEIGQLQILRRYPFKGMRGEDIKSVHVSFTGLRGDRVYALVDPDNTGTFPWVTPRLRPEMLLFEPRFKHQFDDVPFPDLSRLEVEVTTPEGAHFRADDPAFLAFLENRFQRKLKLRFSEKGMQDARPISILGLASLKRLEEETGLTLDHRRFRANFYVEWKDAKPLYEEDLMGRTLQFGEKLQVMVTKKNTRCTVINLDPATAMASTEVLKTVGKQHKGMIGVYAATLQDGVVTQGDAVFLL